MRRVAFIQVAQRIGLSLGEIAARWDRCRRAHTDTRRLEQVVSRWLPRIDEQIAELELLRDRLDGCIGCGCLSLDTCELYNTGDRAARRGAGARYLLGDPIEVGAASRQSMRAEPGAHHVDEVVVVEGLPCGRRRVGQAGLEALDGTTAALDMG